MTSSTLDAHQRPSAEVPDSLGRAPAELQALNAALSARNRQQSAVAAVSQCAIRERDLAVVIREAAAVTAATLDTKYSAVGQLLDGDDVLLRAGAGWDASFIGRVGSAVGTPVGYMLQCGAPVVIAEVGTETRFPIPQPLTDHGVKSAIYVIIRGRARMWGTLSAYSTSARAFSQDDIGFLQSVANVLGLAIERHELEAAQAREQEILQAVFDNIPVMVSFYAPSGELLRTNRAWEKTLGWSLEEALSIDILAAAYPEPRVREDVIDFISRSERQWRDFKTHTRSGTAIDTSWSRFRLSDGSRIGFGLDLTDRKRAEAERDRLIEEARASHERLGALSRRLLTAQEEERRRLAVELHDELGQVLTAVKINLESLERSHSETAPMGLKGAIDSVDHAMRRVRDIALDLRPSVLDDLGLPPALRWYVDRFARGTGMAVHVAIDAVPDVDPDTATACFRVAQEALTNVARHARAQNVWLELRLVSEGLELEVRDDGIGFEVVTARRRARAGESMGLLGMEERVSLVGGVLDVHGEIGAGSHVRARFPHSEKIRRLA